VLAALVLALDDDACRKMRDADGGFDFVDVLAAVAAGAEGVELEIVRLHDDFDAVVNFGNHEDGSKRGVPPGRLVKRRNPHEAMDAAFSGKHSVGVFAFDLHGGGFDARLFSGGGIEDGGAKTPGFRPAHVHAEKHLGPVLGFGAAGAGLDGEDGVERVAFAGEESLGFELGDEGIGGVEFLGGVGEDGFALGGVGLFLGEVEISFDVAGFGVEGLGGVQAFFELLAFLKKGLGLGLVLPEIGGGGFFLDGGQELLCVGGVKDSSGRARCVWRARRSVAEGLRFAWVGRLCPRNTFRDFLVIPV